MVKGLDGGSMGRTGRTGLGRSIVSILGLQPRGCGADRCRAAPEVSRSPEGAGSDQGSDREPVESSTPTSRLLEAKRRARRRSGS